MMKLKLSMVAAVVLLLAICLFACSPRPSGGNAASESPEETQSNQVGELDSATLERNTEIANDLTAQSTMPEDQRGALQQETLDIVNSISERAFQNLPEITTTSGGVKIQRTPATPDNGVTGNLEYDYLGWNTIYLNSEHRGCTSCHSNLGTLVETMSGEPHTELSNEMGLDIQSRQCIDCHSYCTTLYDQSDNFTSIMHSLHSGSNEKFKDMGGDCMSCHYVESGSYDMGLENQGEMLFWDDVKYDLMRGITDIASEATQYDFNWDQTYTLSADNLFNKNFFHEDMAAARKITDHLDVSPNPSSDGIYDTWEIEISGDVANPFTMTIQEMIDTFGLETDEMTMFCGAGPVGTNLIGNYKIKGISLKKIMEYAQAKDDITILEAYAPNGHMYNSQTSLIEENDGYLVLEVGDEPLPYHSGYPVQLWVGGAIAWSNEKNVCNLNFRAADLSNTEEFPAWFFDDYRLDLSNHSNYVPGVGVFDLKDGQVFDYEEGKAIEFSGYADSYSVPISAVEFSFDGGETWITGETPNTTAKNWVHWNLNWTPPNQGAYVLKVRSVDKNGLATADPLTFLINVQDPSNPIDRAAAQALLN